MERVTDGMNRIGISITKPVLLAVGLLLVGWLFNTPGGLLGKADAVGYAVCHRIDLRSFYIGDRQLPLCARCTGMYLGAMLGLVYQVFFGRRRAGTNHLCADHRRLGQAGRTTRRLARREQETDELVESGLDPPGHSLP